MAALCGSLQAVSLSVPLKHPYSFSRTFVRPHEQRRNQCGDPDPCIRLLSGMPTQCSADVPVHQLQGQLPLSDGGLSLQELSPYSSGSDDDLVLMDPAIQSATPIIIQAQQALKQVCARACAFSSLFCTHRSQMHSDTDHPASSLSLPISAFCQGWLYGRITCLAISAVLLKVSASSPHSSLTSRTFQDFLLLQDIMQSAMCCCRRGLPLQRVLSGTCGRLDWTPWTLCS